MNVLKYLAAITLVLSIIHASVAIDDGDRKQLLRSKLIATLDHDRKLGGSKSSKAFGGKGNKKSAKSSKASRQSSDGSKPSTPSNANTSGKKQIFNKSGKNSAKSNKSGKAFAAKSSKSSSSDQATKPNPPAPAPVRDIDSTPELILSDFESITFPTPPAPGPSSISGSSTNTGSKNSDEEDIVSQFLDNENEYHGLHAQNLAVGIVAALAVTATVAAVALKRKGKSLWPKGRVAENTGALDAGGMPANATTVKPAAVKSGDAAATPVANNDTFCPQDSWFDSISSCWA